MKKTTFAIAMIVLLAIGGQAFGEICTIDNVPAATLLIPYFKVAVSTPGDGGACDDANAATTFIAISNASAGPVIAHVTVWTDWSVPEIDFDIYLTGYDVQTFDVKNIFCSGILPVTGSDISNLGAFSTLTSPWAFTGCGVAATPGVPPNYINPAVSGDFRQHLREIFTGGASHITGACGGSASVYAQGYITVDANQACSLRFPDEAAYWNGSEVITDQRGNVLWGDYQYIDRNVGTSEGFSAVSIEAGTPAQLIPGPTFYGRYTDLGAGFTFADNREPLPTTYGARYNRGPGFTGTYYQIWREGAVGEQNEIFCDGEPPWDPNTGDECIGLDQDNTPNSSVAFNEQEEPVIVTDGPSGQPGPPSACIPYETQNQLVGSFNAATGANLPTPFNQGWLYLNLQNGEAGANSLGQAYVTVVENLNVGAGEFSGGWDGVALDGSCTQTGLVITPALPTPLGGNPDIP